VITERELRRVAGRAGLGVGQAEHEYVILCALDALSQTLPLSETFCLKDGRPEPVVDRLLRWGAVFLRTALLGLSKGR
jgi:hypothetical protein